MSNAKEGSISIRPEQAMSDAQVGFEQKYDVALAGNLIRFLYAGYCGFPTL